MWVLALVLAPLVTLNLLVATLGRTVVFPLSPYFLREKSHALIAYAQHRSRCLFVGHEPLSPLLARLEARHKLPRHLLTAVVTVESNLQVHRISSTGAMGPAQLMPGTAKDMKVDDPFDPEANLGGGARYLAWLLARYRKLPLAVAAYNAGPGHVKDRIPEIGETQIYVKRVMATYESLRSQDAPRPRVNKASAARVDDHVVVPGLRVARVFVDVGLIGQKSERITGLELEHTLAHAHPEEATQHHQDLAGPCGVGLGRIARARRHPQLVDLDERGHACRRERTALEAPVGRAQHLGVLPSQDRPFASVLVEELGEGHPEPHRDLPHHTDRGVALQRFDLGQSRTAHPRRAGQLVQRHVARGALGLEPLCDPPRQIGGADVVARGNLPFLF